MKTPRLATTPPPATDTVSAIFIDQQEFLRRVPISRRTLFNWRASGKIPFVIVGAGRRILFHWPSAEAALLRQQREIR